MEDDPYEEDMDDVNLDDERKHHWRMVLEDNEGGVEDAKELLHAKRCDIYVMKRGIRWKFSVMTRRGLFGKWSTIMP